MTDFCFEFDIKNIENYEKAKADDFKDWIIHHRLETHTSDGEKRIVNLSSAELKALGMYYYRPANELVFLTRAEHTSLHLIGHKSFGGGHFTKHTNETKQKLAYNNSKRVLCVETGKMYDSAKDAQLSTGIKTSISAVCRGERKTAGGFHWKYVQ